MVSGKADIQNKAGLFGAYAAGFLNDVFGVAAFLWPLVFGALGAAYVSSFYAMHWWRWCGLFLLTLFLLVVCAFGDISLGDLKGGGMVGETLYSNSSRYLSPGGSAIVWFFVLLVGLQLVCDISWFSMAARVGHWLLRRKAALFGRDKRDAEESVTIVTPDVESTEATSRNTIVGRFIVLKEQCWSWFSVWLSSLSPVVSPHSKEEVEIQHTVSKSSGLGEDFDDEPFARSQDMDLFFVEPTVTAPPTTEVPRCESITVKVRDSASEAEQAQEMVQLEESDEARIVAPPKTVVPPSSPPPISKPAQVAVSSVKGKRAPVPLPSLEILTLPSKSDKLSSSSRREDLEARARALMSCLKDFDVQGELVRITPGPVVTMFEVRPAPGIRVNRIANLTDDLALALKAIAVRIQAPIPGSDTVGIEIPNDDRETVNFRELAASESFRKGCGPLTMILGKDIAGQPFMADLTKMPHLLVAGATGAGKSVCLNAILISLLYRAQPEDLRLLLIDPKRIEMAVYADVPHLVHPVVKEMTEAKSALDWAVHEMDRRYEAMAQLGVRNVTGYNQKLTTFRDELPPDLANLEPLPYLVIVIDELADLMMTAAREVETSIVRLAQLARAAGIHMILATQRPSVDVVTGLIKANFPCRISFQVTSKHDSRTILDLVGAEHLLGRGDMLYKPSGGRLQRLHGPFLSDEEVQAVVEHWKHHLRPSYQVDFAQWGIESSTAQSMGGADAAQDPLYQEIQAFVLEQGRASISLVQRRFKIGFNRAARLVEQLEHDGVIGPADGSKVRTVVR